MGYRPFVSRRHPLGFRRIVDDELIAWHDMHAAELAWPIDCPWRLGLRDRSLVTLALWAAYQVPQLSWSQAKARAIAGTIEGCQQVIHPMNHSRLLWVVYVPPEIIRSVGLVKALQLNACAREYTSGQEERVA